MLDQQAGPHLGVAQRPFHILAHGDVARNAECADDLAIGVAQGPFGPEEGAGALAGEHGLLVGFLLSRLPHAAVGGHDLFRLLGREQAAIVVAEHRARRLVDDPCGSLVEQEVTPLLVLREDRVVRTVGDGGEQRVRLLQQPLLVEFALVRRGQLENQPPDEHIEDERCHRDEQPALGHADPDQRFRFAEQSGHDLVGQQDPQAGDRGVREGDHEGAGRRAGGFSGLAHRRDPDVHCWSQMRSNRRERRRAHRVAR